MKAAVFVLASLIAGSAFAAPTELTCRRIDPVNPNAEKIFGSLKLKMKLPDTAMAAPGDLVKQKIDVTFQEGERIITKKTSFISRAGVLSASILYGEDFGAGNFNLYWDYDAHEIVAVIVVSSDGPMNVDIQRCAGSK